MSGVFRQVEMSNQVSAYGSTLTWNSTLQTGHPMAEQRCQAHGSWGDVLGRSDHSVWHSWDDEGITQSSEWNSQNSWPVRWVNVTHKERQLRWLVFLALSLKTDWSMVHVVYSHFFISVSQATVIQLVILWCSHLKRVIVFPICCFMQPRWH